MVVIAGIGVVKDPGWINNDFPDQSILRKQSKGIVNRRLGYKVVFAIHQLHDLVCREMLLAFEQYTRYEETLLGWQNAMFLQQTLDRVSTKCLFVSLIHHVH